MSTRGIEMGVRTAYEVTISDGPTSLRLFGEAVLGTHAAPGERRIWSGRETTLIVYLPDTEAARFKYICKPVYFSPAKTVEVS